MSAFLPMLLAATALGAEFESRIDTEIALAQNQLGADVAAGRVDAADLMDEWRLRSDGIRVAEIVRERKLNVPGLRLDAIEQGNATGFPRQFLHMLKPPLEEARRPLNGMRLFQVDRSVPLGAKEYRVERQFMQGEAAIISGANQNIPMVGISAREEIRPIKYLATAWGSNFLQLLSSNFAGISEVQRKRRAARIAMDELINRLIWHGSQAHDLYGVLTHPDLAKVVSAVSFVDATDPDDVLAELHRLANFSNENSGQTFKPNRCVTTSAVRNFLAQTRVDTTTSTTILEQFFKNSEFIKTMDTANELEGQGPGGTDCILFYNDDVDSVSTVIVQDLSELPAQRSGFDDKTICWGAYGGVRMSNSGNNLLAYVTV